MTEKKDLLNNLKIDRNAKAEPSEIPYKNILIAASVSLVVLVGFWSFFSEEEIIEVSTFSVKSIDDSDSSSVSLLDASGYVVARRKATVSSKITGKVLEVFIEEGDYVEKGQVLAQLDDRSTQAELNYATAQFNEAKRIYGRTKELIEGNLASQASLDAAGAQMDSLDALLAVRRQVVDDMKIRAPFSGVVVYKAAQPGEMISPVSAGGGSIRTGIGTIVDMDSLEIEVDVNESFINRVIAGQPVVANLNAYPKWDIPAEVIAIIPTADRNKATVRVRIKLLEKDERVLPDMGARVSFLKKVEESSGPKKEGVMVPNASIETLGDQSYIMLIRNNEIIIQGIDIAEETSNYSRIIRGLKSGDRVLAKYDQQLDDGQKVKIK
jgi:RND family efflux transporter MFP subunit